MPLADMAVALSTSATTSSFEAELVPGRTADRSVEAGAKPAIWQHQADFTAKLTAFQRAAKTFATVSAGGDAAAAKASYADLGKTCKACHDTYRSDMHH